MSLSSPQALAPLSPDLAFVVQLLASARQSPEQLVGRVEHIASGQAIRFASLAELHDFVGKTVCARL